MQSLAPPSLLSSQNTDAVGKIGAERMQRSADRLLHVRANPNRTELDAVAREFAGQFVHLLMKNIQPSFKPGMLGHGGMGEEVFHEMMMEDLVMESSAGDPFGLATLVRESLLRQQQRHDIDIEGGVFLPPHLRETAAEPDGDAPVPETHAPGQMEDAPEGKTDAPLPETVPPVSSTAAPIHPVPTEDTHG